MVRIKNVLCGIVSIAVMTSMIPWGGVFAEYKNGTELILEEDDFESMDEYETYLAENPQIERQQYTEFLNSIFSSASEVRATPNHSVTGTASLAYTITGLPISTAVQKTFIGSNYIYAIQRSGSNSYLSRCSINGTTATHIDHMILTGFGHTQTLEYYTHDGEAYFLIGCKANEDYSYKWATQIGRIKYSAGSTVNYTSIYRFCSLSYANENGTSFGTIKRADAAMSSDYQTLFLWVQDTTGEIQYSSYDADVLNDKLDELESAGGTKYISFTNNDIKNACYGSFRQSGSNRVLPNGSCQGVEFNNANNIFIIGGNTGETPKIAKLMGSGSNYTYSYLATISHNSFGSNSETEGIQLKGNNVYFGIYNGAEGSNKIYYVSKSIFD